VADGYESIARVDWRVRVADRVQRPLKGAQNGFSWVVFGVIVEYCTLVMDPYGKIPLKINTARVSLSFSNVLMWIPYHTPTHFNPKHTLFSAVFGRTAGREGYSGTPGSGRTAVFPPPSRRQAQNAQRLALDFAQVYT